MNRLGETACLILVGAFWGCTNPLLRKGSAEASAEIAHKGADETSSPGGASPSSSWKSFSQSLLSSLANFRHVKVWLFYLLNQCGSLLYYFTLANSDLSLAVPICNALSLVFSIGTSHLLGERIHQPVKTVVGAALVMGGVAICLFSQESEDEERAVPAKEEL